MFDIVIKGGVIVDGSGSKGYKSDIGIIGEYIETIGDLSSVDACRVIDATGNIISPGFIDTHTHSEGALLIDPQHACGLRQGITTEFLGLDGMSYAPLSNKHYHIYRRWLGGILGDPPDDLDMSSVAAFKSHYHKKVAVNTAYLVPNGTIRLESLGFRDIPLTGDSLKKAEKLIRESIEQGAVGFSTGSKYYPGPWSDTQEVIKLCKSVRDLGAIYMAEIRSANTERAHSGGGIGEALEIARKSGVKLHLAHTRTNVETAGQVEKLMEPIDRAKLEGVDCTLDIYPYPTGSSIPISFLPSYVHDGGPDEIMRRLSDPNESRKISHYLDNQYTGPLKLEEVSFSYLPKNNHLEGMTLFDIAIQRKSTMGETLCHLLFDEDLKVGHLGVPPYSVKLWNQIDRDSLELLSRPDYMVCSDITPLGNFPHPRCYGAFPRFLGRLRRKYGVINLEQMIQRMTDKPARRFGLTKRGRITKGYYADIVVFDSERVIDNATYDDPCQFPTGIPFVIVNGKVAVDNEKCTGELAGHAVP